MHLSIFPLQSLSNPKTCNYFFHYNHCLIQKHVIISKLSVSMILKYIFLQCASQKEQFDMSFLQIEHRHSSIPLKQILQLSRNASTTNLMHVTAI